MIEVSIDRENNVIIATARDTLAEADFTNLSDSINDYINSTDQVPALVLNAESLPHWKNSAALFAHIKLVRDHQKILPKVALVSDKFDTVIDALSGGHFCPRQGPPFCTERL